MKKLIVLSLALVVAIMLSIATPVIGAGDDPKEKEEEQKKVEQEKNPSAKGKPSWPFGKIAEPDKKKASPSEKPGEQKKPDTPPKPPWPSKFQPSSPAPSQTKEQPKPEAKKPPSVWPPKLTGIQPSESKQQTNVKQPTESLKPPEPKEPPKGWLIPKTVSKPSESAKPESPKPSLDKAGQRFPTWPPKPPVGLTIERPRPVGSAESKTDRLPTLAPSEQRSVEEAFVKKDFERLSQISARSRISQAPKVFFRNRPNIQTVTATDRERTQRDLKNRLFDWNRGTRGINKTLPDRDVIGNPVPRTVRVIDRRDVTNINIRYTKIVNNFGCSATNHFLFTPRTRFHPDFFGRDDGYAAYRRHHHHTVVILVFFFPYYFSDPYWYGLYYPGYYPSVYALWGWCPGWIYPQRVWYDPFDYICREMVIYRDYVGVNRALSDIKQAWLDGDIRLISEHLTDRVDVRIYFEGQYSYTLTADDFYAMTADVMATTSTTSIHLSSPIWISGREVFVRGEQTFLDPSGNEQTLYLFYRLRLLGSDWYIVAFGSSTEPIRSPYR